MSHPRKRAERWAQADLLAPLGPCGAASRTLAGAPAALQPVPPQAATPARSAQAELWCALHLPALCFEAVWNDGLAPAGVARAVIDGNNRLQRLLAIDPRARAPGVQPGMTLAAALAACPALQVRSRDARRERLRLVALAEAALAFTPRVSLEPPDELLLELQGSLRLFGGAEVLAQRLRDAAAQLGLSARLAWAPTPRAALAGARGARGFRALHEAQLVGQLAPLPVTVLREPVPVVARLASMGVNTLGELLRLPRAGLAQRFGPALPLLLDRLVGRAREPRRAFVPAVRFRGRCEPLYELSSHAALLRHLEPLLTELEQFLRRRQCALTALRIRLRHRAPHAATRFELRLAAPEFAAQRFAALLAEHCARLVLPAPVRRIELRSGELLPLAGAAATSTASAAAAANGSDSLWRPGEQGGAVGRETPALLERLRARLGHTAVHGLCLIPDHRPEASWRIAEPALPFTATAAAGTAAVTAANVAATAAAQQLRARQRRRPLWLLATPRRLGALPAGWRLLDGPERIETGWWDGHDVARDYYLLRDAAGAELWAFRDRQAPHDWFLHGVFG
jgi:protein ImuB